MTGDVAAAFVVAFDAVDEEDASRLDGLCCEGEEAALVFVPRPAAAFRAAAAPGLAPADSVPAARREPASNASMDGIGGGRAGGGTGGDAFDRECVPIAVVFFVGVVCSADDFDGESFFVDAEEMPSRGGDSECDPSAASMASEATPDDAPGIGPGGDPGGDRGSGGDGGTRWGIG